MSASSKSAAPWIACKGAFIQDPLTETHRRLLLQWAHEHRAWQADRHQVVFSHESRHNLWDHEGCIHVRRYAGERCLPECVIERHSGLTPGVMVWGVISYHGRSNLLRIEDNLNSNRYVHEVLQPEIFSSFKASLELSAG
ncbi:transposable element Tcb1 transposase [Trichonephila clavipes]|nr:transposable element Tcb1 transposase [Trichonephila clavipes]